MQFKARWRIIKKTDITIVLTAVKLEIVNKQSKIDDAHWNTFDVSDYD